MATMHNCAAAEELWMQSWWLAGPRGTLELMIPVEMQKGFAGMEIIPHLSTTTWPSTHTHHQTAPLHISQLSNWLGNLKIGEMSKPLHQHITGFTGKQNNLPMPN